MNTRDTFARNNWSTTRRHLDYSRHLCATTRSTTLLGNGTSRSFSDSETATFIGKTGQNRNVTFGGHLSDEGRVPRKRVYNMDQTFLKKLGHKNGILEKHSIAVEPHQTNRKVGLRIHCTVGSMKMRGRFVILFRQSLVVALPKTTKSKTWLDITARYQTRLQNLMPSKSGCKIYLHQLFEDWLMKRSEKP